LKLLHTGTVSDGQLKLSDRKRFDQDIKQFEGKRVEVVISKANKRRSNNQNAYYWGLVLPCAVQGFRDAGHEGITIDDAHRFFKDRFLTEGVEIVSPRSGEVITMSKTTTVLSTTGMMDYVDQVARFCAEFLGVVIPEPIPLFNDQN